MNLTQQLIQRHEGRKPQQYLDSRGIPSIGIGHNLKAAPPCAEVISIQEANGRPADNDWLDSSIDFQYTHDLEANASWLYVKPWWGQMGEPRQAALADMAFNLGPVKMQDFNTFLGLISVQDFDAAAADLLKTAVYQELPKRYGELETIIRTGSVQGILA